MAHHAILGAIRRQVNAEERSSVSVEVVIKQEDAEQVAMFKLVNGGGDHSQGQPDVLDLPEVDPQGNTGHQDQTVPDEMHRFPVQFPKDAVSQATNSIPAKAVALMAGIVDEDELEHLHHVLSNMTCLQDHKHKVSGHKAIMLTGPENLHGEERHPWKNGGQRNSPQGPVKPDCE